MESSGWSSTRLEYVPVSLWRMVTNNVPVYICSKTDPAETIGNLQLLFSRLYKLVPALPDSKYVGLLLARTDMVGDGLSWRNEP